MWLKLFRAHVIISGDVQGVNFRFYTRIKARNLGLKGFVRNLDSGEVEAIFEGEEDKIKEILNWCRKGPNSALVKDVKVNLEDYVGEFESFEVL
jgi:acylphosphatase